jgi:peroxiredoxin
MHLPQRRNSERSTNHSATRCTIRRLTLLAIGIFATTFLLAAAPAPALAKAEPKPLSEIPAFRLKESGGRTFSSGESLPGRIVLLAIWRLDQPQSIQILEDLVRLRKELPSESIAIVSIISGDVDRAAVARLKEELEIEFPVLFDPDRSLYGEFGVIVSPSSWFADADGRIHFDYPGYRRDFPLVARTDIAFLRKEISEKERAQRLQRGKLRQSRWEAGPSARYQLAARFLEKGDRKTAEDQFRIAWKDEPRLPEAGVELGLLLLGTGRNKEALAIFGEVVALVPEDPRALAGRGVSLLRTGRRDEGADMLRGAIAAGAAEPLFYYELARWIDDEQGPKQAAAYYRRGLEPVLESNGGDGARTH